MLLAKNHASKRCKRNGKQYRPWSDWSSRSTLTWIYTVGSVLPVQKLRIITVSIILHSLTLALFCPVDSSILTNWKGPFICRGVSGWFYFYQIPALKGNSVDHILRHLIWVVIIFQGPIYWALGMNRLKYLSQTYLQNNMTNCTPYIWLLSFREKTDRYRNNSC